MTLESNRDRPFRHGLEDFAVGVLEAFVQALPPRGARRFARGLGALVRGCGVRTDVARANLARALPGLDAAAREAILRESYAQAALSAVDVLRAPRLPAGELDTIRRSVRGLDHVAAAREGGRGAVLLTGHFGAFELIGAAVAREGHPVHFLVRAQSNALVDARIVRLRRALGVGVIGHGSGVRDALRLLRRGECVAVLADQDAGPDGVFVDFFGSPTSTPPGPAEFSVRTGAPIVAGYLARTGDGGYVGEIAAPLVPPQSGDRSVDVRALTQAHTALLEEWIRERPEQWLWTHRRWKTPPPAAAAAAARRGSAVSGRVAGAALALALAVGAASASAPASGATPARAQSAAATAGPAAPLAAVARPETLRTGDSSFDGAGSSVFPLERARVRRVFEGVRIRRIERGWSVDAEEVFQAGVAPVTAAMGLPDYRASLPRADSLTTARGTVRGLRVEVDGLPMGTRELPGSAAPGQDLGGIERLWHFDVPFSAQEIRTVRLEYEIGESLTDRGEPLLFFYLNPGSLWEGENAKVTVSVDLGAESPEDLIVGWLRPGGYRLFGNQVIWRRRAGDEVADIALAFRPYRDPLAAFADRQKGPLALSLESREEWLGRLTPREMRFWLAFLEARRGAPIDSASAGAPLLRESWYRPGGTFRLDRLPREERQLYERLRQSLGTWERARVPLDQVHGAAADGGTPGPR